MNIVELFEIANQSDCLNHQDTGNNNNNNKLYSSVSYLEGHSQPWDRADLDTTFASLKSDYLNPKSNLRVGYI